MIPIKIYAKCLRSDIEYKTLSISHQTTSTDVIWMLLSKYKMRHRDPKLFFLTMEIGIAEGSQPNPGDHVTTLHLEDNSRPAELRACYPKNDCRFALQMKKGGLVRIYDSVLMAESKYKCLLISDQTTVQEVINILFHCYGIERKERVDHFAIAEVSVNNLRSPKLLKPNDCPSVVQSCWKLPNEFKFVLRRSLPPPLPLKPFPTFAELLPSCTSLDSLSPSRSLSDLSLTSGADSEMSLDLSSTNPSPGTSMSSTPEQKLPFTLKARKTLPVSEKLTFDQSVQTMGPQNEVHLSSSNFQVVPPVRIETRGKKNQTSQTVGKYISVSKRGKVADKEAVANFNLNMSILARQVLIPKQCQPMSINHLDPIHNVYKRKITSGGPLALRSQEKVAESLTDECPSFLTMTAGTRRPITAFSEYENYFYI